LCPERLRNLNLDFASTRAMALPLLQELMLRASAEADISQDLVGESGIVKLLFFDILEFIQALVFLLIRI
jgi:hypothetical protein